MRRGCLSILGNIIPSGGSQNKFASKTFGIKGAADVPHSLLVIFFKTIAGTRWIAPKRTPEEAKKTRFG